MSDLKNIEKVEDELFNKWMKRMSIIFRKTVYSAPIVAFVCIMANVVSLIRQLLTLKGVLLMSLITLAFKSGDLITEYQKQSQAEQRMREMYESSPLYIAEQITVIKKELELYKKHHETTTEFDEKMEWKDRSTNDRYGWKYLPKQEYIKRKEYLLELENNLARLEIKLARAIDPKE